MRRLIESFGDRIVVLLFFVALGTPMVLGIESVDDATAAKMELRELAPAPATPHDLHSLLAFPTAFEKYFNDHFGGRRQLIAHYMKVKGRGLGVSPSKLVVLGTDNWLYFTKDLIFPDYRGEIRLTPAELEGWRYALEDRQQWLQQQGAIYLFAVAPNKISVHPEHLPAHHQRPGPVATRLDQITAHLAERSQFRILDLRPPMRAMAATQPAYLFTDSHWNRPAAFVGYQALMRQLQTLGSQREPMAESAFTLQFFEAQGDLARLLPALKWPPERMATLVPNTPLPCKRLALTDVVNHAPAKWNMWEPPTAYECPGQEGVLLMFKDSFAASQMEWFACHFRYSFFLSMFPQDLEPFDVLTKALHPTVVIEQRVERNMYGPPARLLQK